MKRLLVVTAYFPPERGGIQTYLERLFSHLQNLFSEDVDIHILAPSDRAALTPLETPLPSLETTDARTPFSMHRAPLFSSRGPIRLAKQRQAISRLIDQASIDTVILGHFLYSLSAAATRVCARRTIPFVQLIHGYDLLDETTRSPWRQQRVRSLLRSATHRLTTTHLLAERCAETFSLSLSSFSVLPPGVDPIPAISQVDQQAFRERYTLSKDTPLILCVGRLVARKGQDALIRALPLIRRAVPKAHLLLVGGGTSTALQKLAQQEGVANAVTFTGDISPTELHAAYRTADVFCLPNREDAGGDVEGYGIVFLEAMSAGLPVIGGTSGGVPEAIHTTGLLVDGTSPDAVADTILSVLTDPSLARTLSQRSHKRAQQQTWSAQAEQFWQLIHKKPFS